ncbi:MAG: helix-turn-helix domain-containing protein [Myxococcales bacterium]|nr:helix-turn-helix domain-containing protein [Myxococcales bacterium]
MTSESTDLVSDGLMTVSEAAGFLRLSRSTIYLFMDRGELAFVKLGRSRRIPRLATQAALPETM